MFLRKLRSRWSGPYTIGASTPFGEVTQENDYGCEFKVNCQILKLYLRGNTHGE